jgi:hypothetical protein
MKTLRVCLLLLAAALARPAAAEGDALPPGVAARVHGKDIREADVLDRLAKRWGRTEKGRRILEHLVDDRCVAAEARRRNVSVTEEEVVAFVAKTDDQIRKQTGGARTIDDVYREQKTTPREFAVQVRQYLLQQKMASEELGTKPGQEVTEARLKLWLAALRRRQNVRWNDLPEGVFASIGDDVVDRATFAKELRAQLSDADWYDALAFLVMNAAAEHALAEAKIVVTDEEVEADIAGRRAVFAKDPRVAGTGLTYDEFLKQTEGTSEAEQRADPRYRTNVGLLRLLSRGISEGDVKKSWEENRDAYGERALVRQIYVAAQDKGGQFQGRSFEEGKELALRAKVAVLEASGQLPGRSGAKSLADAVSGVAKQFEEDPDRRAQAGEPAAWSHVNLLGHDELDKAVFSCPLGTLQGPVRSPDGWHLFLVEERRPAPSFDEVKDVVREDLLRKAIVTFKLRMKSDPGVVLPKSGDKK